ncbi:PEP-CTERM sorting domain-containing protein [Citrifermentans bremense]|uniref:PEP-CTERM sorting domain-containing protein n=1 Tax=Citrifermentans bremense TaxID=60035 RepID=UPI000410C7A2|nr:PEP-CTERM sorting domain-containing protein [Citrifermentans bremense]
MKKMITLMICTLLLLAATSAQALVVSNSSTYLNEITPSGDAFGPEVFAGLGTFSRSYSAAGSYNILAFIDNDLDVELTGFYPETAGTQGSFDDRFSYQVGDPFDIAGNFLAGSLDNSVTSGGDVAVAMGWRFDLLAGQTAQVSFSASDVLPLGPGYIWHHDAVLLEPDFQQFELLPDSVIYYVSSLRIEDAGTNPVPEPSTFILFGSAFSIFAIYARKRKNT